VTEEHDNLDPFRLWNILMANEKPGGHGERSVAVGVIDMAVWDAVAKIEGKPLYRLLADRYNGGSAATRVFVYAADVTDPAQVAALVAATHAHHGRIDVLINLAGTYKGGKPVHEADAGEWELLMNLNARSVWLACRAVVPHMLAQGGGYIVNVAARAGVQASKGAAAYAASKAAVIRITESVSLDVRDNGINVNCVLPSTIDTPQNRAAMPKADASKWVGPDDLAAVVRFLASDGARAIHGAAAGLRAGLSQHRAVDRHDCETPGAVRHRECARPALRRAPAPVAAPRRQPHRPRRAARGSAPATACGRVSSASPASQACTASAAALTAAATSPSARCTFVSITRRSTRAAPAGPAAACAHSASASPGRPAPSAHVASATSSSASSMREPPAARINARDCSAVSRACSHSSCSR
jgi:NAD(P)-dependent dehydrogenase (short-subunit alcohol dehydrogenase family)